MQLYHRDGISRCRWCGLQADDGQRRRPSLLRLLELRSRRIPRRAGHHRVGDRRRWREERLSRHLVSPPIKGEIRVRLWRERRLMDVQKHELVRRRGILRPVQSIRRGPVRAVAEERHAGHLTRRDDGTIRMHGVVSSTRGWPEMLLLLHDLWLIGRGARSVLGWQWFPRGGDPCAECSHRRRRVLGELLQRRASMLTLCGRGERQLGCRAETIRMRCTAALREEQGDTRDTTGERVQMRTRAWSIIHAKPAPACLRGPCRCVAHHRGLFQLGRGAHRTMRCDAGRDTGSVGLTAGGRPHGACRTNQHRMCVCVSLV
jgi:hypothetical protein